MFIHVFDRVSHVTCRKTPQKKSFICGLRGLFIWQCYYSGLGWTTSLLVGVGGRVCVCVWRWWWCQPWLACWWWFGNWKNNNPHTKSKSKHKRAPATHQLPRWLNQKRSCTNPALLGWTMEAPILGALLLVFDAYSNFTYFLESPRWLLGKGRFEEALKVMGKACKMNKVPLDNLEVKMLTIVK